MHRYKLETQDARAIFCNTIITDGSVRTDADRRC